MATRKEIAEAKEQEKYWRQIEKYIPEWELHGWTFKRHASFHTPSLLSLTGQQYEQILAAVRATSGVELVRQDREGR